LETAPGGVSVVSVDKNGPAQKAGLRPGDLIESVNGEHVDSNRGLIRTVAATAPGAALKLLVSRKGKTLDVTATVGRRTEGAG
ncbi:MAG: PDZ domain-containing protein, partial [Gluconacetobacter diazotrophicus]|nr:PDZ domain-containing protein [Gluconacetobacter diazotrophicus]